MQNKFYNKFDCERLHESKRTDDYRTPFQIDRDRLIHSSEFRRLQGKTQVFLPGEYDFYRTRLTHSIEVAQIGRSLCNYLTNKYTDLFSKDYFIDPDLVEASCLAHDFGHPPFGHAGERTLHKLMKPYGAFEGNAQTLRLITEIFYTEENRRRGMNPTRAFVDGILKYKTLFGQLDDPPNHFLYDYQKVFLEFVFANRNFPAELLPGSKLNDFRSIECQIMDWADDSAYIINDLVDSISGGFLTVTKIESWKRDNGNFSQTQIAYLDEIIEWMKTNKYKAKFGSLIGEFIRTCSIKTRSTFMDDLTNRYKYELIIDEEIFERSQLYKQLAVELVFRSFQLHQMEFKGDHMLIKIFDILKNNYIDKNETLNLLPKFTGKLIKREADAMDRARLICDYVAGMTDSHAMRTYRRLFDPDYSSLVDLV